jgi:photosystem II stability/assembly factor-like uncharacterized protein
LNLRIVITVLFPLHLLLSSCQATAGNPWEIVDEFNVHHSVMTAGFLDESFGITGGTASFNGTSTFMNYTTDGGRTWPEGVNVSDCRYGMEIFNEQYAWTCGGMSHVRLSIDGGRTWQPGANFGQYYDGPCRVMSFIDPEHGWLANQSHMGSTSDGANSWKMLPLPDGVKYIAGIGLYAPGQGYMMDSRGLLYHTLDDGSEWSLVSGPDLGGGEILRRDVYAVTVMRFQDVDHGIIVLRHKTDDKEQVIAYHTSDAGRTWTSEIVPVTPGPLYISQDGRWLTVITGPNIMTLLHYNGK